MENNIIISNEEMNDIIKTDKVLENYNIFLKGITKTIEKETKEHKRRIFRNVIRSFNR